MGWRRRLVLALLLAPSLALAAGWLWLHLSLPPTSGRLAVAGLAAPLTITRDAAGIPHIRAGSESDAAFALGYVHAGDRLFQMDMMRRLGAGRLAEVLGPAALPTDEAMRTLGLYRAAERQFATLSPSLRQVIEAYAAGVNAYLDTRRALPPEYDLLAMTPEDWRPADTLVWGKYMDLLLAGNYRSELLHARLATTLTADQLAELFPAYPADAPVTLGRLARLFRRLPLDRLYAAFPGIWPSGASNNWVVDGRHTVSGKPLLANDPHLGFATPGIWYLARIDAPGFHLAGATSPGTPFLVLGHNDRIGWGFTTTGGDVEDVFIEKLDPTNPGAYLTPEGARPFATRQETIRVRGAAPVTITVRSTRHGPVISDIAGAAARLAQLGYVLALATTFLGPDDRTPQALWGIEHARDWASFNTALADFVAPEQNIVYADVGGTIGFTAPARIPIRGKGEGWLPSPGWTGEYDWTGYVPFAALPRAVDPPDGRFISANNRIVPDFYPYFITRDWDIPNRAERIAALLDATPRQSPDAAATIQADTLSLMSRQLLPLMLRITPPDARAAAAIAILKRWGGRMDEGETAPLIFTAWLRALNQALFAKRLGPAFPAYWGLRPLAVRGILGNHQEWCGSVAAPGSAECAAKLAGSLSRALDELTRDYGADMAGWRWGRAHQANFPHPLFSRTPLLRDLLAIAIPAPGGSDTVNRGEMLVSSPDQPYLDRHGAGLRMILDFADLDASRFMIVPGESGNPLSAHYRDLLHPWHDFAWLTLAPDAAGETLKLEPK